METRHIAARDGLQLVVDVHGDDGDAVLLVHGLGFSRRSWTHQVNMLVAAGRRVVVPGLRGFGGSAMPSEPYDMEMLADDLEVVRETLAIEELELVGHSMGGMVAQCYVLCHPARVRTLFLASTTSHNGRRATAFAKVMCELSREGFDAAKANPERWPEIESTIAAVTPFTGPVMKLLRKLTEKADAARAMAWDAVSRFSVVDQVQTIGCPTTVMHGQLDANIPFAAGKLLAEAIEGSTWIPVEDGRHNLPLEKTELFNRCLNEHLQLS